MGIMTILGSIVFVISVKEEFTKKEYHLTKCCLFMIFGLSTALPMIHFNIFEVKGFNFEEFNYFYWVLGGLSYISGTLLYILKFPERLFPGKLCIFGNSHQILHCCAVIGIFCHYYAGLECYIHRSNNHC